MPARYSASRRTRETFRYVFSICTKCICCRVVVVVAAQRQSCSTSRSRRPGCRDEREQDEETNGTAAGCDGAFSDAGCERAGRGADDGTSCGDDSEADPGAAGRALLGGGDERAE